MNYATRYSLFVVGTCVSISILIIGGFFLRQERLSKPYPTRISPKSEVSNPAVTQRQTSNVAEMLHTYRNEKYGFEIKYPSQWEVTENSEASSLSVIPSGEPARILTLSNKNKAFSVGVVSGSDPYGFGSKPEGFQVRQVNVDGVIGRGLFNPAEQDEIIILPQGELSYVLYLSPVSNLSIDGELKQMLSSFRFLSRK